MWLSRRRKVAVAGNESNVVAGTKKALSGARGRAVGLEGFTGFGVGFGTFIGVGYGVSYGISAGVGRGAPYKLPNFTFGPTVGAIFGFGVGVGRIVGINFGRDDIDWQEVIMGSRSWGVERKPRKKIPRTNVKTLPST